MSDKDDQVSTAHEIDRLLHEKYSGDPWFYFPQVPDSTGFPKSRTIDGIAVNVWPSQFQIIAHEVKVSRSDFLNEIQDPSKRAPFIPVTTQFYYVVPNRLVNPAEVPKECGLMYAQKNRIIITKIAQQREVTQVDVPFLMSMVRQAGRRFCDPMLRFAGKEIDVNQLESEITKRVDERVNGFEFKRQVREEVEQEWEKRNADYLRLGRFVAHNRRKLGIDGYGLPTDEDLEEWLNNLTAKAQGRFHNDIRQLQNHVDRAKDAIERIVNPAAWSDTNVKW